MGMFVNMDPSAGGGDGGLLIGRNQDPRMMFTVFNDAQHRKNSEERCAADGKDFWVKISAKDEWERLETVDGIAWPCLSRMSPKQPEVFTALDIMVAIGAATGTIPDVEEEVEIITSDKKGNKKTR